MSGRPATHVDHAEIRMGQMLTMLISSVAIIMQDTWPLIGLGLVFLLSGTVRAISPFSLLYRWVVRPSGMMTSDYRLDNIQPHKFGQLIGALTVAVALALIHVGMPVTGWTIVLVLIVLTAISYSGWCVGCFLYYQLNRAGIGGFFRHAPTDNTRAMGSRPAKSTNLDQ